ncbi:hypothetical protein [Ornithinimicrobium faecis]|uniref:hypothetical protein n=1 Tax=Ornithinimicrobium faecis TaxID=2934158 RepID=UPI002118E581|nr:hypothetical protein [Ornithinimicrobium sp. HY1745]
MLQPALLARRLSDGLYGKLEYDFACQRGHGFGEAYVHGALIDLLASNLDSSAYSIESGYAVAELQPDKPDDAKSGRKREVDFAVISRADSTDNSKVQLCLEVKWAGSSHATPINVLRDLVRLQLVVDANPRAVALFVLAGPKRDVPKLLGHPLFTACDARRRSHRILSYPPTGTTQNNYRLSVTGPCMSRHLAHSTYTPLLETFPRLPASVRTSTYRPSHAAPPNWEVQVLRVFPVTSKLDGGVNWST